MPALVIGAVQRQEIANLRALAAANPQDVTDVQAAADRDIAAFRDMQETLSIELPVGYFVCYTHEKQPQAGLCHHISISVARPNEAPSVAAVETILREFGMGPIKGSVGLWIEDISPETKAINIVQPLTIYFRPCRLCGALIGCLGDDPAPICQDCAAKEKTTKAR